MVPAKNSVKKRLSKSASQQKAPLSRFYYPEIRRLINAFIIIIIIDIMAIIIIAIIIIIATIAIISIMLSDHVEKKKIAACLAHTEHRPCKWNYIFIVWHI